MKRRQTRDEKLNLTNLRINARLVKLLWAIADLYDLALGDFVENVALNALAGRKSFSDPALERIGLIAGVYGYDLNAQVSKPRTISSPLEGTLQ
jgi:hypothetical protein